MKVSGRNLAQTLRVKRPPHVGCGLCVSLPSSTLPRTAPRRQQHSPYTTTRRAQGLHELFPALKSKGPPQHANPAPPAPKDPLRQRCWALQRADGRRHSRARQAGGAAVGECITLRPCALSRRTVEGLPICWWLPPPKGCSTGFIHTPRTVGHSFLLACTANTRRTMPSAAATSELPC